MTVKKYIDTPDQVMTHPKLGASWEGFALDTLCRSQDKRDDELYFFATHPASELDLFCQGSGRNWGAEFKYSDAPRLTKSMKTVIEALYLSHVWVIYPGDRFYRLNEYVDHHALTPVLPPKWQENMMNVSFRQYVENGAPRVNPWSPLHDPPSPKATAWSSASGEGRHHAEANDNSIPPRINAGSPAKADKFLPFLQKDRPMRPA